MCWPACLLIWVIQLSVCVSTCVHEYTSSKWESYTGKVPTDAPRLDTTADGGLACLSFCTHAGVHVSVIYVPPTSCMCYFTLLPSMTFTDVTGAVAYGWTTDDNDYVESWITRVITESSHFEWSAGVYPATTMIGPFDHYPNYGDSTKAWSPEVKDDNQFVELEISEAMYISEISIFETYFGGAVSSVSIRASNLSWVKVWTSPRIEVIISSRIFKPPIQLQDFKSNAVRLDVDLGMRYEWSEFDAVKVAGTRSYTRTRLDLV